MTVIYEFTDPRGTVHEINEHAIKESYRTLASAGYDMTTANDLSLDYVLASLTIQAIPENDLLYGNHDFDAEERLCADVATRLYLKQTRKN